MNQEDLVNNVHDIMVKREIYKSYNLWAEFLITAVMITEGVESVISHPGVDVPVEEVCTISAHRVIVAARCDWFRRALLSGMREAIDR